MIKLPAPSQSSPSLSLVCTSMSYSVIQHIPERKKSTKPSAYIHFTDLQQRQKLTWQMISSTSFSLSHTSPLHKIWASFLLSLSLSQQFTKVELFSLSLSLSLSLSHTHTTVHKNLSYFSANVCTLATTNSALNPQAPSRQTWRSI